MRVVFANTIIKESQRKENLLFLTGDLGFMALEGVRDVMKERFINAGVAEQNMVSMAAALAYEGFIPITYSISPFITLRPYEQIRNDVCLHNLPVKIVGNGGGFGYGIMGATHHNIEDIGSLRLLPNMKIFVPYHDDDISDVVFKMIEDKSPNYLRLNLGAKHKPEQNFTQWRRLKSGKSLVVIGTGPVVENLLELPKEIVDELEIWIISIFPFTNIPLELLNKINELQKVLSIEEHQGQCGLYETLAASLLKQNANVKKYDGAFAQGYLSGRYGSQKWHQEENGLAGKLLLQKIKEILL